jgi:beta-alanine--pyruvate transaminase
MARRPGRLLDALHRQPAVQEGAAPAGAAEGMHYWTPERPPGPRRRGRPVVRERRPLPAKIVQAIQQQAAELDFAPPFQMGHPKAFELAEKVAKLAPAGMNKVFFTNSGSEAVETALKMAIAYHRVRGEARAPG